MSRVTNSVKDNEGNPRDIEHPKLFSDHSLYEVSFLNGQTEEMTANVIDENVLSQLYSEGHHHQVLKEISGHSADGSVLDSSAGFIRSCSRNLHAKKTTGGWRLEVEWKY